MGGTDGGETRTPEMLPREMAAMAVSDLTWGRPWKEQVRDEEQGFRTEYGCGCGLKIFCWHLLGRREDHEESGCRRFEKKSGI